MTTSTKPTSIHTPTLKNREHQFTPLKPFAREELPKEPATEQINIVRDPREEQVWRGIVAKMDASLTSNGLLSGSPNSNLLQIESGFIFAQQPNDTDFSYLHIEPLIDQASDLLDRGIRDRASYDDIASKWMLLVLELTEFAQLDAIHQQEEVAGYYDVPAKQSYSDYLTEAYTGSARLSFSTELGQTYQVYFSNSAQVEQSNAVGESAWTVGCFSYGIAGEGAASYVNAYASAPPGWPSPPPIVPQLSYDASMTQFYWRQYSDSRAQFAQWGLASALASVSYDARQPGLLAKSNWDAQNATFLRMRTQAARQLEQIKGLAAFSADGVLNYAKRLTAIQKRFQQDFRDALARLIVVADGMQKVYGYTQPLPQVAAGTVPYIGYFDDCLLWARAAVQWLVRFSRQDQSLVLPISVRESIGDDAWKQGLERRAWELELGTNVFEHLLEVRLRGLSATVDAGAHHTASLWQLSVQPPKNGIVVHLDGTKVPLDQTRVPPCRLGRATSLGAAREPDVTGRSSLHNASPIGAWRVAVAGSIPRTKDLHHLEDVVLNLFVSYRARPARDLRAQAHSQKESSVG